MGKAKKNIGKFKDDSPVQNVPEEVQHLVKKGKEQAFGTNQFGLKCYPDILIVKVEEIKEWLVNKIESDEYSEEKIEAVFCWIQDWE
jgi:hypothetical protein